MSKMRILLTSILGNALELYDFTLYAVLASAIGATFFPSENYMVSFLASWGAFAAGFIMRPFGGIVFGHIGDKFGRKKALSISILLMGIPTLVIGILPGFSSIGMIAPLLVVLCRLLQGLCTGGEYNGAAIFALEHIGKKFPGFSGGLIGGSCAIGAFVASFFGSIVLRPEMPSWAWRAPFVLGSIISLIGFYIRSKITETPEFEESQKRKKVLRAPLKQALSRSAPAAMVTFFIGLLNGACTYTMFGFFNVYLTHFVDFPLAKATQLSMFSQASFVLFAAGTGYLMDRIGKNRYFFSLCLSIFALSLPVFLLAQTGDVSKVILAQILIGGMAGGIAGPMHAFVQDLFPVEDRYSGIAFSFCMGMAIGGGPAPILQTLLVQYTGSLLSPAIYLCSYSLLLFAGLLIYRMKFSHRMLACKN